MKLGCSTLHYEFTGTREIEAIRSIADIGYKGVELTYGIGYFSEISKNIPDIKSLKNVLDETGLKVVSFSTSLFWGQKGNKVKYNKILLEKMADIVVELKGDHIVIVTGPWPEDLNRDEAWNNMVDNFSWAADMVNKKGLKLAVESVVRWGVRNAETFLKMRKQVEDKLYANVDPSNYGLSGDDPVAVVKDFKSLIGGIHLKDSKFKGFTEEEINSAMTTFNTDKVSQNESRPGFCPTEVGDVDFRSFLKALKEVDYKNWCMFEYEGSFNGYYKDPVKASSDSYNYFNKIMEEI